MKNLSGGIRNAQKSVDQYLFIMLCAGTRGCKGERDRLSVSHELMIWAMTRGIVLITLARATAELTEDYMGLQRKRLTSYQTSNGFVEEVKAKLSWRMS